jgi:hypothetical protein
VIDDANGDRLVPDLLLRVTAQAKVWIRVDEQLPVDRAMGVVADRATLTQRFVLKHYRPDLFTMALRTAFVEPRQGETAGRFENVSTMRIMALHAVHAAFEDRVMLRQTEFSMRLEMAFEARSRLSAGIQDETAPSAADLDVPAAGPVTGFATRLSLDARNFEMNAGVRARRKAAHVIRVTVCADLVADKVRAWNLRGIQDGQRSQGA